MRPLNLLVSILLFGRAASADGDLDESKAIHKVELLGGRIMQDDTQPGSPVHGVDFSHRSRPSIRFSEKYLPILRSFSKLRTLNLGNIDITDDGLSSIQELRNLTGLIIHGPTITDEGLKKIFGLSQLEILQLNSCRKITDAGLKDLHQLKNLQLLNLSGSGITDAGLTEIGRLPNLKTLVIGDTRISGVGLKEITGLSKLTHIDLSGCKQLNEIGLKQLGQLTNLKILVLDKSSINDEGLKELSGLKRLVRIFLNGTKASNDGINELRRLLPEVDIVR